MNPVILMRVGLSDEDELAAARKYFDVYEQRANIPSGSCVIGRYSVLPYYRELAFDLRENDSLLVNSYREHLYIADLRNWYMDLSPVTFKTWFSMEEMPKNGGPFVLKGATNSKKQQWKTHMYAENYAEANQVHKLLAADGLVGNQDIYIRKYEKLRSFGTSIAGHPITEEYRFFYYGTTQLSGAFYWSEHSYLAEENGLTPDNVPEDFLSDIAETVAQHASFYVVDVGRKENGEWVLIELNDGQMSGLSNNDPYLLYENLSKRTKAY